MGWIQCSNDAPELFKLTKPYCTKLAKWMKKNWEKNSDGQFVGPEARQLLAEGAKIAYLRPGLEVETKII